MMWQLTQVFGSFERYDRPRASTKVKPLTPKNTPSSAARITPASESFRVREDMCAVYPATRRHEDVPARLRRFPSPRQRARDEHEHNRQSDQHAHLRPE